ncbi:MAG TPA: glycoside hydrolase family 15 protein [Blastocatellia bacterium]|nr:glycoside hydrolase family 15 protein [Blastocatellia bacterium]
MDDGSSRSLDTMEIRKSNLTQGAIGNGRVLGLVSPTSAIDWLCFPRFDSPSFFCRLLDHNNGGTFRFLYGGQEIEGRLSYIANTNVLISRFERDGCIWEVIDFAPWIPDGLSVRVPIQHCRLVRPITGQPRIAVDFDPRPDYARVKPELVQTTAGLTVLGGEQPVHLSTNVPIPYILDRREFVLNRPMFFVLSYGVLDDMPSLATVNHALELTVAGWRAWSKTCALPTFAPHEVLRSALCLKLHIYHDTGAIIAAATTSIPEALGTQRTWDYRYCWLRDAAFVVEALRRLGHLSEGEKFIRYLRDVAEAGPLQPLYGIGGEREMPEQMLTHLAGFEGNGYVRVGNAAALQHQNDLMGEILLCLETILNDPRIVYDDAHGFFPLIERLVEDAVAAAPKPDTGIWEFRSLLRPYTFSRAMCWVAVNRGASVARKFGREDLARRWEDIAEKEQQIVLNRGFNPRRGIFTQSLDGENPDASNLLLPTLGIIDARDPRFVSTVDRYQQLLVDKGLMLRYITDDDFGETTSAFTICCFWWAEALALVGRLDEAVELFQRLMLYANNVGLFSEDIDPATGGLLGNFPQAYTHVGLIHAATTIGELLEARDRKVRAWV